MEILDKPLALATLTIWYKTQKMHGNVRWSGVDSKNCFPWYGYFTWDKDSRHTLANHQIYLMLYFSQKKKWKKKKISHKTLENAYLFNKCIIIIHNVHYLQRMRRHADSGIPGPLYSWALWSTLVWVCRKMWCFWPNVWHNGPRWMVLYIQAVFACRAQIKAFN